MTQCLQDGLLVRYAAELRNRRMTFDYFAFYTEASLVCVAIFVMLIIQNNSAGYDFLDSDDDTAEACLKRADERLYLDKQRNKA